VFSRVCGEAKFLRNKTYSIGLIIAGSALSIAGGVIAHQGRKERYGVNIISPKRNEIGGACNF